MTDPTYRIWLTIYRDRGATEYHCVTLSAHGLAQARLIASQQFTLAPWDEMEITRQAIVTTVNGKESLEYSTLDL